MSPGLLLYGIHAYMHAEEDVTVPATNQAATGGGGASLMAGPASGSPKDKMGMYQ